MPRLSKNKKKEVKSSSLSLQAPSSHSISSYCWRFSVSNTCFKTLPLMWSDRLIYCCWVKCKVSSKPSRWCLRGYIVSSKKLSLYTLRRNYSPFIDWILSSSDYNNYSEFIADSKHRCYGESPAVFSSSSSSSLAVPDQINFMVSLTPDIKSIESVINSVHQKWHESYGTDSLTH